ncbi:ribonuclease H, partial [Trifolium pratense]
MKLLNEYDHASKNNMITVERSSTMALIGWSPPQTNYIKLNTYGAFKDQHTAGCGGVIRGCDGEWLGGYAKGLGLCSAFVAKLWDVLE